MQIKFKKLSADAIAPYKASEDAIGYDLFAPQDFVVQRGRNLVKTNIAIEIPAGFAADVRPRSGYSLKGFPDKDGQRCNADVLLGTIDPDYRGDVGVIINNNDGTFVIGKGQRIAQLVIHQCAVCNFVECDELSQTERGNNGFNSTGK